jgi:hypothetical protein
MNRDLFLAILSMDSYNRGYGQGVMLNSADSTSDQEEAGRRLGRATILNVDLPAGSVNAGFYAIAYELPAGYIDGLTGTVISYRGTNFDPGDSILNFFNGPLWQDIRTGWSVGAGWPAMLSANHPPVAANDNQMDAGLERAFRFVEARAAA